MDDEDFPRGEPTEHRLVEREDGRNDHHRLWKLDAEEVTRFTRSQSDKELAASAIEEYQQTSPTEEDRMVDVLIGSLKAGGVSRDDLVRTVALLENAIAAGIDPDTATARALDILPPDQAVAIRRALDKAKAVAVEIPPMPLPRQHDRPIATHYSEQAVSQALKTYAHLFNSGHKEAASLTAWLVLHMTLYKIVGAQVLSPSQGLVEALQRTEAPEEWSAPYPAFYVAFEEPIAVGDRMVAGMYFAERGEIWDQLGKFQISGNEIPQDQDDMATQLANFFKDGEGTGLSVVGIDTNGMVGYNPKLDALTINLCAYIEALGPDRVDASAKDRKAKFEAKAAKTTNPKKRKKAQRRAEKACGATVVYLGASIPSASRSGGGGRSNAREHWVRGHWRNQAYGFGKKLRRQKWIQPHKRCTDNEPTPGRTYRL